jgi:CRP-like cAMP-binding protein
MNHDAIKAAFNAITPVDDAIWSEFEQYFSFRTLKKNEYLWQSGDVCKHVIFLQSGLIHMYDDQDEKKQSLNFFFENKILADYYSFTTQAPCDVAYQAIEPCELILIPRPALYMFYDKYPIFDRLGRLIAEMNFIFLFNTKRSTLSLSPEEKYLKLIAERPKVMERVPLKFIASFLGMTPEHLSRVRKSISK